MFGRLSITPDYDVKALCKIDVNKCFFTATSKTLTHVYINIIDKKIKRIV